jgi:hypothetical protein
MARVLKPELRNAAARWDGGLCTSAKAARWMVGKLGGLAPSLARMRGAAGDRLVNPEAAGMQPEGGDA